MGSEDIAYAERFLDSRQFFESVAPSGVTATVVAQPKSWRLQRTLGEVARLRSAELIRAGGHIDGATALFAGSGRVAHARQEVVCAVGALGQPGASLSLAAREPSTFGYLCVAVVSGLSKGIKP